MLTIVYNHYDSESECPIYNRLLRIVPQISAAFSKLKSVKDGPSMLILIKQSSVDVLRRFLRLVLIRFIEENARSHSAVLIGIRATILHSFVS